MRRFAYLIPLMLLAACQGTTSTDATSSTEQEAAQTAEKMAHFGAMITPDNAMPVAEVPEALGANDSVRLKIEGTIEEVCQMKGCWITMQVDTATSMRVTFKDYAIFLPKDVGGRTAVLEGYAFVDTVPVEMVRHYAEDAGKSEEEIAAITEPETKLTFLADAVIIKDYEVKGEDAEAAGHGHHDHEGHDHAH